MTEGAAEPERVVNGLTAIPKEPEYSVVAPDKVADGVRVDHGSEGT